jgi:hypothetical protein
MGMMIANGFQQNAPANSAPTQSVEGFDVKQMAHDAKDRVKTFIGSFSEKLYMKPKTALNGLYGDEQVTYFINPHSGGVTGTGALDMTALDTLQSQIAEMSARPAAQVTGYIAASGGNAGWGNASSFDAADRNF